MKSRDFISDVYFLADSKMAEVYDLSNTQAKVVGNRIASARGKVAVSS